mmetsp:Transcript_42734/g.51885  ORF Transcript_42734/g.51885 Transcript_42734/m.51885 type:complete len:137 (-) Transcript_42734:14-424(-)|eukprot:CAMPEP_0197865106 /NCGR_PEP_ID=MMETSP1438-20131217/43473_1 /TAXON_ID=1461541 /ORGANISM="Pterosperma sp., Strain CCMP1384" /LENGTH=136 /DNA_ID=CAMNT_0043483519 /DNA_START=300 /DNA_END=710 /DNA_ORIENTATION=+
MVESCSSKKATVNRLFSDWQTLRAVAKACFEPEDRYGFESTRIRRILRGLKDGESESVFGWVKAAVDSTSGSVDSSGVAQQTKLPVRRPVGRELPDPIDLEKGSPGVLLQKIELDAADGMTLCRDLEGSLGRLARP